jgi:hypothetical protein
MILMSEKMTSQKKLGEIKSVPYNKPHLLVHLEGENLRLKKEFKFPPFSAVV